MAGATAGELVVYEDLGLLYLEGTQQRDGERLKLSGWVTEVSANRFTLSGALAYVIPSVWKAECRMSGSMTFTRKGNGPWRLDAAKSPCNQGTHTVDIQPRKE
jgi:hypothetical protein